MTSAETTEVVTFSWFVLYENPATTTEPHPVLGAVPICDRCAANLRAIEAGR